MNKDRWRMQERINELRSEMAQTILKNIPDDGSIDQTVIEMCHTELLLQKAELVALARTLNFLNKADNEEHHERANKM